HFHRDDLDAERLGALVDDGLNPQVELVAMAQHLVQLHLAQHRTQRGLGKLGGLVDVVGDLDGGVVGIHHVERDHRVHFQGNVVAGDDVLGRNLEHLLAQREAHYLVDGPENQDDTRPLGRPQDAAQTENHTALILLQDLDGVEKVENDNHDHNQHWSGQITDRHWTFLSSHSTDCTPEALCGGLWRAGCG